MFYLVPSGQNEGALVKASQIAIIKATRKGVEGHKVNGDGKTKRLFEIPAEDHAIDKTLADVVQTISGLRSTLGLKMITLPDGNAIDPTVITHIGPSLKKDADQGVYIRGEGEEFLMFIATTAEEKEKVLGQIKKALSKAEVKVA